MLAVDDLAFDVRFSVLLAAFLLAAPALFGEEVVWVDRSKEFLSSIDGSIVDFGRNIFRIMLSHFAFEFVIVIPWCNCCGAIGNRSRRCMRRLRCCIAIVMLLLLLLSKRLGRNHTVMAMRQMLDMQGFWCCQCCWWCDVMILKFQLGFVLLGRRHYVIMRQSLCWNVSVGMAIQIAASSSSSSASVVGTLKRLLLLNVITHAPVILAAATAIIVMIVINVIFLALLLDDVDVRIGIFRRILSGRNAWRFPPGRSALAAQRGAFDDPPDGLRVDAAGDLPDLANLDVGIGAQGLGGLRVIFDHLLVDVVEDVGRDVRGALVGRQVAQLDAQRPDAHVVVVVVQVAVVAVGVTAGAVLGVDGRCRRMGAARGAGCGGGMNGGVVVQHVVVSVAESGRRRRWGSMPVGRAAAGVGVGLIRRHRAFSAMRCDASRCNAMRCGVMRYDAEPVSWPGPPVGSQKRATFRVGCTSTARTDVQNGTGS
mmetsp:Transcript_23774/g.67217  ORF Transcript_23774/g.67217 Transcript_23774/m.67217 type:complete len:481 (+) Transcript_23774:1553-2995(+)